VYIIVSFLCFFFFFFFFFFFCTRGSPSERCTHVWPAFVHLPGMLAMLTVSLWLLWLGRKLVGDVLRVFPRLSHESRRRQQPRRSASPQNQHYILLRSGEIERGQREMVSTHLVWLPLATSSSCSFVKRIEVYARVLPTVNKEEKDEC
jgi:hypothetical protein